MAKRSVQELITKVRGYVGENIPDGYEEFLEDLTDSVTDFDASQYVSAADYNKIVNQNATLQSERDTARQERDSFRERYINRFYNGYDKPNDKGYVMGAAPQQEIEKKEEWGDYQNLFE